MRHPTENSGVEPIPRIVVVGGGFGGLESLFYLRQRLGKRIDLTLVSESPNFAFKPNTIYIPFGKPAERYVIPLEKGLKRRHIEFIEARATGVDPAAQIVHTTAGDVPFDYAVLATGAGMRPAEVPGLEEFANTIWTPQQMEALGESVRELVAETSMVDEGAAKRRVLFVVPPNNKCSGPLYELVFMLETYLRRHHVRDRVQITYTTFESSFIMAFGPRLHELVVSEFDERGIDGRTEKVVVEVNKDHVRYADGDELPYDLLIAFPPYVASTRFEGLPSDERGFLRTEMATRQVESYPNIYAVGDTGDFPVKQAFLALLQADAAGEHIAQRVLHEEPDAEFDPVSMCIMEQFDKATFAQVPLELTGDPARPVAVREQGLDLYKVGSGSVWRVGKKMLGTVLPSRFRHGKPFHAGATWALMEAGLKVMSAAFAD